MAFEVNSAPRELQPLFRQTGGNAMPYLVYTTANGQFLHGTNGGRSAQQLLGDLQKVLDNKAVAASKTAEAELTKQVEALEKALEGKKHKEAVAAYQGILKTRGYSPVKDQAFDLMDNAQAAGAKKLDEAFQLVKKDEYSRARQLIEEAARDLEGLPLADDARQHLAAVKLLEAGHQATVDQKGPWKQTAARNLDQLLRQYLDTPYASLAVARRKDLAKN